MKQIRKWIKEFLCDHPSETIIHDYGSHYLYECDACGRTMWRKK